MHRTVECEVTWEGVMDAGGSVMWALGYMSRDVGRG
jgi:hypothetical protein